MIPEEAIEILEEVKELDDTMYAYNPAYMNSLDMAIESLKEIQQYREIGTVEEIKSVKKYIDLKKRCGTPANTIDLCAEYVAIGTVEECREAVEKQKPKRCNIVKDYFRTYYNCPKCNHNLRVEYNRGSWMGKKSKNCDKCGQAIRWDENLEGMEE